MEKSLTGHFIYILTAEQIKEFSPSLVSIQDGSQKEDLLQLIKGAERQPEIVIGNEGILEVASHPDAEAVVTGIVGCAGLGPTCAAISKGKDICLANKETLIAGKMIWKALLPGICLRGIGLPQSASFAERHKKGNTEQELLRGHPRAKALSQGHHKDGFTLKKWTAMMLISL